jgi:hypothetical protein
MLAGPEKKKRFYQTLIDQLDTQALVINCEKGQYWMLMESDHGGVGLAHFLPLEAGPPQEQMKPAVGN